MSNSNDPEEPQTFEAAIGNIEDYAKYWGRMYRDGYAQMNLSGTLDAFVTALKLLRAEHATQVSFEEQSE